MVDVKETLEAFANIREKLQNGTYREFQTLLAAVKSANYAIVYVFYF